MWCRTSRLGSKGPDERRINWGAQRCKARSWVLAKGGDIGGRVLRVSRVGNAVQHVRHTKTKRLNAGRERVPEVRDGFALQESAAQALWGLWSTGPFLLLPPHDGCKDRERKQHVSCLRE
jgi:hypothetical protein